MCGIAVYIDRRGKGVDSDTLTAMANAVKHRGPDGSGLFIDGPVGLGHRRLAIIDLTECGKQPMFFEDLVLVFNGEIYNYIELREELKNEGYRFDSESDSEVLLKSYHLWGSGCLHKLRGMWAFSIFDKKRNIVFISRDRFGIKPLHYTQTSTSFLAGSEIKQFMVTGEFEAKMFHPVAYEFLEHGILNHNKYTFFENVYTLRAGHNLVYDLNDHSYSISRWYFLEKETGQKKTDPETAARQFREIFENAVRIHLRSDVKLGSCLSGGLDSSSIVSMSRKILGNEMPIYTVTSCNTDSRYDESEYAKAVVEHCRTEEVITYPDLNALYTENLLEKIVWYHDQPIPSGSHFSEYAVFEAARKNDLIVMLDGQGSDEYMAGYHEFFMIRCKGLFKKGRFKTLHRTIVERSKNRGIPVKSLYTTLLKMVVKRSRQGNGSSWLCDEWVSQQKQSKAATYKDGIENVRDLYSLSLLEIQETSIPYQLHSEDRNAMFFSIESRVPFLDHVLVESMLNLPEDAYYRYALDKAPLREGLKDILPEKIYQRRTKLGFVSSDEVWMQQHGQEVKQRLAAAVNDFKGIIKTSVLDEFDKYLSGERNYDGIFFRILSLHAWCRATKAELR